MKLTSLYKYSAMGLQESASNRSFRGLDSAIWKWGVPLGDWLGSGCRDRVTRENSNASGAEHARSWVWNRTKCGSGGSFGSNSDQVPAGAGGL